MIAYLRLFFNSFLLVNLTFGRVNTSKDETPRLPPWVLQADNRFLKEKCMLIYKFLSSIDWELWGVFISDLLSLTKWIIEVF
jgi:hypothetical protein